VLVAVVEFKVAAAVVMPLARTPQLRAKYLK
jgi:hypothetical protein